MNILIIQGPNINLIGLRSAKIGEKVTLDKVNQGLRKQANKRPEEITLKILQTHKVEKAMTLYIVIVIGQMGLSLRQWHGQDMNIL